ncbi:hypothetical protein DPMN_116638 [Dreissena polymorpha]|uniref:Uncharacterized protein n=1 Tax=Dreissena polymorpha TaxID=45954 RepID=A0A9D4KQ74_DREPO|nr:hypothetical protein DPMN_116638 [Dreissena polymorpha]
MMDHDGNWISHARHFEGITSVEMLYWTVRNAPIASPVKIRDDASITYCRQHI